MNKATLTLIPVCIVALCFAGCLGYTDPLHTTVPFNKDDFAFALQKGNGKITGSMFYRMTNGNIKQGAGEVVYLYPSGPFMHDVAQQLTSRQFAQQGFYALMHDECTGATSGVYGLAARSIAFDSTFDYPRRFICSLAKETVCDAQSAFEFSNLPAGEYYLEAKLSWVSFSEKDHKDEDFGYTIRRFVTIKNGEEAKIVMTP